MELINSGWVLRKMVAQYGIDATESDIHQITEIAKDAEFSFEFLLLSQEILILFEDF